MTLVWGIAILALVMLAYIRLAPSRPEIWHVPPKVEADKTFGNGVTRRVMTGAGGLERFQAIAAADPRTDVLAGSVDSGMITFISRTRMVGFPDYTTVQQDGEEVLIYARSRFGRRDFGVNATRVDAWIDALRAY
ncbi:DUF1499 domain-containing protein [Shimia sp. SDUM112013]|uniref:DUF1499 domain-containing protein n=1 Tax=Shimia sp. SDUM112013 TaxID=3136160 RepID=UPI0032F08DE8